MAVQRFLRSVPFRRYVAVLLRPRRRASMPMEEKAGKTMQDVAWYYVNTAGSWRTEISMDFLPFPNWQRKDVCRWSRLPNASNLHFLPEGIHRRRTVKVWKENKQSIPNFSTCNRTNCGFLWHLDLYMSGWCRWILSRRELRRHGGRDRAHDRRHLPKAAEATAYSKPQTFIYPVFFFVKTETSRGKQTILNPNPVGRTGRAEIWKTSCKMEAQAPQMAQPHGHICNREAWIVQTETIDVAEYFIYFICMYFHHLFGRHWWPDASADHNSAWRFGRPLWGQEPKGLAISSMREKAEKAAYDCFDDDWYTYIQLHICILTYCMHNAFKHLGNSSIITFKIFQVNVGHDAVDCSAVAALSRLRFKINLTKAGGIPRMYVELCGHRCKIQDVPWNPWTRMLSTCFIWSRIILLLSMASSLPEFLLDISCWRNMKHEQVGEFP